MELTNHPLWMTCPSGVALASITVQWLTLTTWVIVAAIALPLSRGAAYGRASLGVQAVAAFGGLAITIAICGGSSVHLGWWAVGCGVVGVLAISIAAASLIAEREWAPTADELIDPAEGHEASLAGVELPLLVTTTILTALVALNVGLAG